ncbi:ABC transporter ATP-binding protein [Actinacidiphila sp. ITFR-21]|uniref:ABC transporter ATP-binding protein n=1 Tax=Actinacidiphila sp. ITFR-21 TaxID=3075199 RepID=UPI00288A4361|nr:ATP-binding cassette domain-containing protein [Streptomyces sp. ITFR-21]WNI16780.1 ATP-binding cassette domain-containing protein [Streptomyces sp. ITFR-21]
MIRFDQVGVVYDGAAEPVLRGVDLCIEEGELCLVVGRTGAGKSSLLGTVNGLVPHFTGGTLSGRVTVAGRDTAHHPPRELADVVGVVGQDPAAGFVTDTVEEELAYAMEQLAIPAEVMRKRVEETLDLLGLADLRHRALRELSGGQQQRVAIGSVLTAHPRVLVLDEPTSALDPTAAEEVLAAVTRLVHDLGVTVVLAEHRLERVVQYADRVVHLAGDGTVTDGPPATVFRTASVAPPVVRLGRLAGWDPLPLSVRDARRAAVPLRAGLADLPVPPPRAALPGGGPVLTARGVVVRYGGVVAVREVDIELRAGQVTALMGRNGSGKSSLLWALHGVGPRQGGTVEVTPYGGPPAPGAGAAPVSGAAPAAPASGAVPPSAAAAAAPGAGPEAASAAQPAARRRFGRRAAPAPARRRVCLVPQTPTDLLYLDTVGAELAQSDRESAVPPGSARRILDRLAPGVPDRVHPRDLSEGQKLALVLAVQLTTAPSVILLDEPTRGLDYRAKLALTRIIDALAAEGRGVVISTHDVEFAASAADRVVVLAEGEVVADGPTADVIVASPAFAPQTAKILAPLPYLTVEQVAAALTGRAADR